MTDIAALHSEKLPQLSVCIATRNRPNDLIRCLRSLVRLVEHISFEIIVIDDASDSPISEPVLAALDACLLDKIQIIRHEINTGYIVARNELAQFARAPYVMSLDDDALVLDANSISLALEILEGDAKIGAIALAQTDAQGQLLSAQPAPVNYRCYSPTYIGYGHILRRKIFLELGGYREIFWAFYEEIEFCKRMLNHGFYVVYLPDASVAHLQSPIGRNGLFRLWNSCRNQCFAAIYNEPLPMMLLSIPARIFSYWKYWRTDPDYWQTQAGSYQNHPLAVNGSGWVIQEILANFPRIWHDRKALRWTTYHKYRQIRCHHPAYPTLSD
jgi:GT2 family glycosyltransferase